MNTLTGLLNNVYSTIFALLPNSPFNEIINQISDIPYLAELNWFIPVAEILAVTQIWLTAITVYYLYSAILRIVGMIG